ncbi:MAG: hypothetical protein ABSG53_09940, partial [Thermoguttaceae bacterium]
DPGLASTLYQNWLRGLAASVDPPLSDFTLTSNVPRSAREHDQFTTISFTVHAHAKLSELVEFMYKFYSAGFLHQIRKMGLKPIQNSRDLDVSLTIEALSLPAAVSKTQLSKEAGRGLQLTKLSDYRDPIVKRDFFAAYRRPQRERPRGVDPAEFAFVTAFTEVDGAAKVWIQDRMANKSLKLGAGESFTIGNVQGTVQTILPGGEVIVDFDGHRRRLHDGHNLHGGVEIQGPAPKKPDEGDNSAGSDSDEDN